MSEDTYVVDINCSNCSEALSLTLKNGLSLKDHLRYNGEDCPRCKCHLMPSHY